MNRVVEQDKDRLGFKLYLGKVISNDDPDKLNRLQIQILPEFKDIPESDLPFMQPFKGVSNGVTQVVDPIPNGSLVWCLVHRSFKDSLMYYIAEKNNNNNVDFELIKSVIDNISDLDSIEYTNIRAFLREDNTLEFHDIVNGQKGIVFSSGAYIVHKNSGDIIVYTSENIQVKNDNIEYNLNKDGTYDITGKGTIECDSTGKITINGHLSVTT